MQIGIIANQHDKNGYETYGTQMDYVKFAYKFGAPELVTVYTPLEKILQLDAILLPGGADVDSKRFGEEPHPWAGRPDVSFEYFDTKLLHQIIGQVPIIGICRGLQTLNVILGGTLTQHMYDHPYSTKKDDLVHDITTSEGDTFKVNSFHHQCINDLAPGLEAVAYAENGVLEAIQSTEMKLFAVQWHPERFDDLWTELQINDFLEES